MEEWKVCCACGCVYETPEWYDVVYMLNGDGHCNLCGGAVITKIRDVENDVYVEKGE